MAAHSGISPTRVVIVGAGGQGRVVADILRAGAPGSRLVAVGLVDDRVALVGNLVLGLPVLGTTEQLASIPHDAVVIAVGDNAVRARLSLALEARDERIVTVRHPFSSVADDVVLGPGCMISAGAVITPSARLGRGVLVNTNASIDHEAVIADFVHLAPGVVVGGNATVGARSLIGLGANVMSQRRVGADSIVGAGALVARDIPDDVVAVGVPARVIRRRR